MLQQHTDRRTFITRLAWASAAVRGIDFDFSPSLAAEESELSISTPVPFQVVQRTGFDPLQGHEHGKKNPRLGEGKITILGFVPENFPARFEYRVATWADALGESGEWRTLEVHRNNFHFEAQAKVPAGGWYRLEVRGHVSEKKTIQQAIEPIGVGEVFLIAGQSYAAGANDELLRIDEESGRTASFDLSNKSWRIAHDPQPAVGDGGTIWPALGNLLVPLLRTPVGFANAAAGGTASRQWLPGEPLFDHLVKMAQAVGGFRAVLWQQGESDVIEKTSTQQYVENLVKIRAAFAERTGSRAPWLLAKSTLHPTVYNDPAGEQRIRSAIDQLVTKPGFLPGPDTDILGGENRGGPNTRRHFSGIGQRRAAQLWFAAIWQELMRPHEDRAAR